MLTVYIFAAVLGGILLLASALFGGHGDHDADFSADHDADHDGGHADTWLPFFSIRFWTYGLTFFGVTGWVLSMMTDTPPALVNGLAIGVGLLCGLGVFFAMLYLRRSEVSSGTNEEDLIGTEAKVLVPVGSENPGKVRCHIHGEWLDLIAFTDEGALLERGSTVLIVGMENQRARVIPHIGMFD